MMPRSPSGVSFTRVNECTCARCTGPRIVRPFAGFHVRGSYFAGPVCWGLFSIFLATLLAAQPAAVDVNIPRDVRVITPQDVNREITVVTWNLDRGTELEKELSGLKQHPADLVLLQEVDWNTVRSGQKEETAELAKALHENAEYAIEFEELGQEKGGPAYIGQATLTALPISKSRILRFQHQSGFWKPRSWIPNLPFMQRRQGNRIVLVTELVYRGKPLVVYNAHLESRSYGRIQIEQLDEILLDMGRHYSKDTAVIIAGDLNTKYFPSVYLRKMQREGFQSAMGNRTPITHDIPTSLDWIFARGVSIGHGTVRRDLKGSDHYAVYAVIGAQER